MRSSVHRRLKVGALAIGWALALTGLALPESHAQQVAAPPTAGTPASGSAGWYGYVPGQGWVRYAPPSAPVVSPGTAVASPYPATAVPPPPGWAGYAPASAWAGYAPASSPVTPAVRLRALPADGSRRRAANRVVNGNAPQLSYTLPAYREFGTGRNIPLAKPWLPPSP